MKTVGILAVGVAASVSCVDAACYAPTGWTGAKCELCPADGVVGAQCSAFGWTACYDSPAACCGDSGVAPGCNAGAGPGKPTPPPTSGGPGPAATTKAAVAPATTKAAVAPPPAGGASCFHFTWWNSNCNAQCKSVSKPQSQCVNTAAEGFWWGASKDACINFIKGDHCSGTASSGSGTGSGSSGSGSGDSGPAPPTGCGDLTGKIPADGFPGKNGVEKLLSEEVFNSMFAQRLTAATCNGKDFFTYSALVEASKSYSDFANSGNITTDRRELAAFLAQTSHETTGGWPTAPCGPHSWGFCYKSEVGCAGGACTQYCAAGDPCTLNNFGFKCPCAPGKTYSGRGPIQLSWNYNYGQFSFDKYGDSMVLVNDPLRVEEDPVLAMESGLWFWTKSQSPKPSCHDVITNRWDPTPVDVAANRQPGFGMVINIINGGLECGHGSNDKIDDRVNFYKRYCEMMGVSPGVHLTCDTMRPY